MKIDLTYNTQKTYLELLHQYLDYQRQTYQHKHVIWYIPPKTIYKIHLLVPTVDFRLLQ